MDVSGERDKSISHDPENDDDNAMRKINDKCLLFCPFHQLISAKQYPHSYSVMWSIR